MDDKHIKQTFKKLNIPDNQLPNYTNADDFAKNFKKCSVLKDVNISYSSTSLPEKNTQDNYVIYR